MTATNSADIVKARPAEPKFSTSAGAAALRHAQKALTRLHTALCSDGSARLPAADLAEVLTILHSVLDGAEAVRERYDSLFHAVPDPVAIMDAQGRLLELNRAAEENYAVPREVLIGQSIHTINPSLSKTHLDDVWRILDQGRTHVWETINRRADGSVFPVEVHSAAFSDCGERRIVAVARDIGPRRLAERQYRLLLDVIDKGVILHRGNGQIQSCNPAAARILGLHQDSPLPGALRPRDWMVLDHTGARLRLRDLPALRALRENCVIESTLIGLYHRRRRSLTWVSVTAVPQLNAIDGRPEHVISLFSDVTELKRDNTLFRRAQALAHIGGWEWEHGIDRLFVTGQALEILGNPVRQPTALKAFLQLVHDQDQFAAEAALARLVRNGGSIRVELRLKPPGPDDTQVVWLLLTGEAEGAGPLATRIIGTIQDITERKRAETLLQLQALTDPLTGLLNRNGIQIELQTRMARTRPSGVALLYIDLDRFKIVNDLLGHSAGDEVLIGVARRLRKCVGAAGLLARFGGDEFLVLIDSPSDPGLPAVIAQRITEEFSNSFCYGDEEFSITTSVGLAHHLRDGETARQLINNADAAMYDAKRRGRNTWQIFTPALSRQQQERLAVESQLRRALENDEFHLVYQPQVELVSGRIFACEALIRWNNPILGELCPDRFINHAETSGDIVRIGTWVLREACRQIRAWRNAGLGIDHVSVNVSYRQLLGENLPRIVDQALSDYGIPGSSLELEFTERVLIEDAPDTLRTFEAMRAMGIRLVIDDFGEGYSALNYLRRLPLDGLKISKLFLQGIPDKAPDVAICRAIIGIARSLELRVVAEGVENEQQRRFLLNSGVSQAQGFLFGPGWAADRFEAILNSQQPLR